MRWTDPLLVLAAPVAIVILFGFHRVRGGRVRRLYAALPGTAGANAEGGYRLPELLAAGAVGLALAGPIALAQPPRSGTSQLGVESTEARARFAAGSVDVMIAMDVSRSMGALDGAPDRMAAARMAALRVVTSEGVHRVGLVAFAGGAHLLVPLTDDRGLVLLHLEGLTPEVLSNQGTDLAVALEGALDGLPSSEARRERAVVLISDGEGFQGDGPLAAALARARREGVGVHTISVGTPQGAPVPGHTGQFTHARPETLRRIARDANGVAASAASGREITALLTDLGSGQGAHGLRTEPVRTSKARSGTHLAPALALVALLALLGDRLQTPGWLRRAS